MKCSNCGFENNDKAKYCTKCGVPLVREDPPPVTKESNSSKYIIMALIIVILILAGSLAFLAYNMNSNHVENNTDSQNDSAEPVQNSESSSDDAKTQQVSSTPAVESKSWQSIGSYYGSGSGSQTINVPSGKIMVKLSAYPIKNYATNHLYVSGSNGASGGVDWGSHSDVETRSDSFEYFSSSDETFTIDYYETVSWEVEFFRYQ